MRKMFFLIILSLIVFGCQNNKDRAKTGELVVQASSGVPESIDPSITGNDLYIHVTYLKVW